MTSVTFDIIGRDRASAAARSAGNSLSTLSRRADIAGQKMTAVGRTMNRNVTLPVVAAAGAAVKLASDFQSSMAKITGLVGVSSKQVDAWSEDILNLSKKLPQSPKDLADAMFFVTSAGLRGKTALDALTQSARASAAGLGDTQTVADAVTSAMNAYGKNVLSAGRATDILTAAVREGKLEASSLAPVIGKTLPIAKAMGVNFAQVAGAMALMSKSGTNAAQASTQVTSILGSFAKPAAQMITALDKMHLNIDGVRKSLANRGLVPTLAMLRDRAKEAGVDLAQVFGNKRALTGVLQLTGNLKETNKVMAGVAHSTGSTDKAFKSAAQTASFKFKAALSTLQAAGIKLGTKILPAVTSAVDKLVGGLEWFDSRPKLFKQTTLGAIAFAAVLGPILTLVGNLTRLYGGYVRILELTGQVQKTTTATTLAQTAAQKENVAATTAQTTATRNLGGVMAGLRFGGMVAGLAAITAGAKTSNDTLKSFATVGGAALAGFAVGGPAGAAIGAAGGAFTVLAQNILSASDAAKSGRADFSDLGGTLDSLTGKVTSQTRAYIQQKLVQKGAIQALATYGVSARTAVSAVLGEGKARNVVTAALKSQTAAIADQKRQIALLTAANVADARAGNLSPQAEAARKKQIDAINAQITAERRAIAAVRDGIPATKEQIRQKRLEIQTTQDLTGKLKGIPPKIRSKINLDGVYPTTKGVAEVAKKYHLLPKQIRTVINAVIPGGSLKAVERAKKSLIDLGQTKPNMARFNEAVRQSGAIADTDAKRYAKSVKASLEDGPQHARPDLSQYQAGIRNGLTVAQRIASTGGTNVGSSLKAGVISGFSGTAAVLSADAAAAVRDAIAAARRAADAHSPSRKMAALGHDLMDGLVKGIADRELTVQRAMERVQGVISKVGTRIASLTSTRSGFLKTFAPDSIFGTDLSAGGGIGALIAAQQAQAGQASQLLTDVKNVTGRGLSKALVRQLRAQGTSGAAALHAIALGSNQQIKQLNTLNKQTSDSLRAAGLRAGDYARGGSINDDIRRARKQEHVLEQLEHRLHELEQTMKKDQVLTIKDANGQWILTAVRKTKHGQGKKAGV